MKNFDNYQWVEGNPKTEEDRIEENSRFWGVGKWKNFVLPFITEDVSDKTFIDFGCSAGIFLEQAEKLGFKDVLGVEGNKEAYKRGIKYKERINGNYKMIHGQVQHAILTVPVADYMVVANVHYYFRAGEWLDFIDRMFLKTRYLILVTSEKRRRLDRPPSHVKELKKNFRLWKLIEQKNTENNSDDPAPRTLITLFYQSPCLERVDIEKINVQNGLTIPDQFFRDIDNDIAPKDTEYLKQVSKNRSRRGWPLEKLQRFIRQKANAYLDIKQNGLVSPIIINKNNTVIDGNHRFWLAKHLGWKSIMCRRI